MAEAGISEVSIKVGNRQNDIIRIIGLVGNTVLVDIATNAVNIHMCLFFITIPPFSVICKMANQLCITAQLIDLICPLQKAIILNRVSQGIKNKIHVCIIKQCLKVQITAPHYYLFRRFLSRHVDEVYCLDLIFSRLFQPDLN